LRLSFKKQTAGLMAAFVVLSSAYALAAPVDLAKERLDAYAAHVAERKFENLGYPLNHDIQLEGFYKWLIDSGVYKAMSNNAGEIRSTPMVIICMDWNLNGRS